jgi:tetratricopeptide (TPR) repeat protein
MASESTAGVVVVELLGEEFAAVVDRLHNQVLALQAGESVERLVFLEAESGSGKSRLVREFYARMRSSQSVNDEGLGYWPALDDPGVREERGAEALRSRKVIGPPTEGFIRPRQTLPDFFWLQVQCGEAPSGALIPVIELMWPSLRAHAKFVAEAWRRAASQEERIKRGVKDHVVDEAKDLGTEASMETLSRLLSVFDVAVPGLGLIVSKASQAATAVYQKQKFKGLIAAGGELDEDLRPPEELALNLLRMSHPKLPVVVVVEDAHLMDAGLAEALSILAHAGRIDPRTPPVLVIATAWPEGRARETYERWRQELLEPDIGPPLAMLIADESPHPFPRLTLHDRVRMVREHAAQTDQATAELVAAKWTNTFALALALTGDELQDFREGDAFVVQADDLRGMSESIEDLYRDRWKALPNHVQQALMLASGAVPPATDDGSVWPFMVDVVASAAARSGILDEPETVRVGLSEANSPHAWTRLMEEDCDLSRFREWAQGFVARNAFERRRYRKTGDFIAALADELATRINLARGDDFILARDPESLAIVRWLLALQPARNDDAAASAALTLALTLEGDRSREIVEMLTEPDRLDLLPRDSPSAFWARGVLARSLCEVGRNAEAIDAYAALLDDELRTLGPDSLDTLVTRNNLAVVLADCGRIEEAVNEFRGLLVDRERILGPDHPDTLFTRGNLAGIMRDCGRTGEALVGYESTLRDELRVLGPDHPETLFIRHGLALTLDQAGRFNDALAEYQAVLDARLVVLGSDHPDTLATRLNIAGTLRNAGKIEEALAMYPMLLADTARVLGSDHPTTLAARQNRALALADDGQVDEALEQCESLLMDRLRALGADHPDTLLNRGNLAWMLIHAGRAEEAVDVGQALLEDSVRVLGQSHPMTLGTRGGLAWALAKVGRGLESIDRYKTLLEDLTREMGTDHPDTLEARGDLASVLAQLGMIQEAMDTYQALLADQVRVLGPEHADTLEVRRSLESLQEA